MKAIEHAVIMDSAYAPGVMKRALQRVRMEEERLPFTVKVVRGDNALEKAVRIRQAAYARHVPEFAAKLGAPEANDHDQGSVVLLAESKMDGSPLGTMRIQTNRFRDIAIARSVELPAWLKNHSMAEATRLGVELGRTGRVVKTTLFKAYYLYCVEASIDWMVIAARSPLDRQYEALLFQDLYPGQFIALRHANNMPHRVLALEVKSVEPSWREANHALYNFFFNTYHPDLDLSDADFGAYSLPNRTPEIPALTVNA